jgi:cyclomaltodextrinase
MVPTDFWLEARAELKKTKPDIMLLAEASKSELLVKAFDIDYDWPLLSTLNKVLINGAPASELQASWEESRRRFPPGALHMRVSDDHDEARAVARYGIRGALAASVLMFTLDGVPLLYNGMEVGDATESGDPALFDKLTIFWHPKERPTLRNIYRDLIRLRKQYACFRNSDVTWLRNSDEADVLTFMRADDRDQFVVLKVTTSSVSNAARPMLAPPRTSAFMGSLCRKFFRMNPSRLDAAICGSTMNRLNMPIITPTFSLGSDGASMA